MIFEELPTDIVLEKIYNYQDMHGNSYIAEDTLNSQMTRVVFDEYWAKVCKPEVDVLLLNNPTIASQVQLPVKGSENDYYVLNFNYQSVDSIDNLKPQERLIIDIIHQISMTLQMN